MTLAAALVYANALANGLVWDDPIVLTRQLLAFKSLRDFVFIPRDIPQYAPDYYRPLTELTYLVDRAIGGSGPFMFHLSVVFDHALATYLVFRLGLRLFAERADALAAAGLGAALFALHPIHSESVAWGAGRSDVLATCAAVAAALVYLQPRWSPWRRALLAALLVFIGMLAKETAVGMLLLLPAADVILGRSAGGRSKTAPSLPRAARRRQVSRRPHGDWHLLVFAAVLIIYFALRRAALGTLFGEARPLDRIALANVIGAVGLYLGKLLLPIHQSAYISDLPTDPLALGAIVGAGFGILIATGTAWQRGARRVVFLLAWIACTLAPSLSIVLKIPAAPVAERYLYLPSVGFCLLCGLGAARLLAMSDGRRRFAAGAAVGAILVACGAATVARNTVWRSNLTLWGDTASKNTTDGLPMRSLAAAYQNEGDVAAAARYFQLALQRRNDAMGQFTIHNNLGSLAMQQKQLDAAEREYRTALGFDPQAPDCIFNLGLIALTRATASDPAHDAAWKHEQAVEARRLFEQAAQLSPLDPDIQIGLGQTLSALGDADGARAHYTRALDLDVPPATATAVRRLLAGLGR